MRVAPAGFGQAPFDKPHHVFVAGSRATARFRRGDVLHLVWLLLVQLAQCKSRPHA